MSSDQSRPAGLWIVGIMAIVLGGLGCCGGTFQLVSVALQDAIIEAVEQAGGDAPGQEFQREVNRRSLEIARSWRVPTIASLVANMLGSLLLLLAAILLFTWNPNAVMVFMGAAAFSILVDTASAGLGIAIQQETMAAMQQAASEIGTGGNDRLMGGIVRASGNLGLCWAIGWLVAKLSFYVGSVLYLRKETVRGLFA